MPEIASQRATGASSSRSSSDTVSVGGHPVVLGKGEQLQARVSQQARHRDQAQAAIKE